jgi:hypothetical protein
MTAFSFSAQPEEHTYPKTKHHDRASTDREHEAERDARKGAG